MIEPLLAGRPEAPSECEEAPPRPRHGNSATSCVTLSDARSLDNSKVAQLVRYGAYLFIWVIGVCAMIKLLTDFSSALKPLVMAALVSSILEWLVQFWEFFFWKVGNFVSTMAHKLWTICCLSLLLLYGSCHGLYSLCCVEKSCRQSSGVRERSRPYVAELCNWTLLKSRWHGSYAGQNSVLRFISVCTTLALVIAPLVGMYTLIMANVSSMLTRLSGYKEQLLSVLAHVRNHLDSLPEIMPEALQNEAHHAIEGFERHISAESVVHDFESYISASLEGIISQTETFAIGTVFFLLYTFLWLFVPMHVNSLASKAKTFRIIVPWGSRPKASALRYSRSLSYVKGEDEPLREVQEHLYKVIWQYFLAMVIINAVYAGSVLGLMIYLGVDLSAFIAIASFFLGFIPELGAIISTVLPIGLVALEPLQPKPDASRPLQHEAIHGPFSDWSERSIKLGKVLAGMIIIKLAVANVLTSIIMGRNRTLAGAVNAQKRDCKKTGNHKAVAPPGCSDFPREGEEVEEDDVKETHPVIILFAVVISGEIWGAVGMLISVPVISFLRLAANIWFLEPTHEKEV
mmetsp:Transcript_47420/g.149012  ORF Transcript_47420/g.149012 Transcript_47420/m.149012 type:complete len:573 (+) Transcript_47420:2-1720(+)